MGVGVTECFRCGTTEGLERFGNAYIYADCTPGGDDTTEDDRFNTTGEHENPIDVSDVTDAERADMLSEYLERFADEFGSVPRLMPLDDEGKASIIKGCAKLDSPEWKSFLVDGREAVRQIREEGARGFAIYAGKAGAQHREPKQSSVDVEMPSRNLDVAYQIVRDGDDQSLPTTTTGDVDYEGLGFTSAPSSIEIDSSGGENDE